MAIEAVQSMVMKKLTDLLTREPVVSEKAVELNSKLTPRKEVEKEPKLMKAVEKELERMKKELEEMGGYFVDAESKWSDPGVKEWCQEYLKHLYGVDDAVESLELRCKTSKLAFRLDILKNHRLCRKIKDIRLEIQTLLPKKPPVLEGRRREPAVMEDSYHSASSTLHEVGNLMTPFSFAKDRNNQSKLMYNYSFDEEQLNKSLKQGVTDLVKQLLDDSKPSLEAFAILGDKGSGKTTLARRVYGNRQVKEQFSCSAWITPSIGVTTEHLLFMLLRQIRGSDDFSGADQGSVSSLIFEHLKDKRYFIVLDDVESCEMWDDLRSAFPNQPDNKGSKVLLITCDAEVANRANKHWPVEKLNLKDSWDLFLKKAGYENGPEGMMDEVFQACNGLPLNLILLGSLLSTKGYEEWPKLMSQTKDLISLCYEDLPSHLKLCLIYMVIFPKEFDIPVRRLQRLWQAEGFVKPDHNAKDYFDNLKNRSLIQVSKQTSDGSPKRCRLLGSLHDRLISKAEMISLFHIHNRYSTVSCDVADPVYVRRLVEATDINDCMLNPDKLGSLRSYLSFNFKKNDTPGTEVGKLLSSVLSNGKKLLRVIDLEGVYKPSLPDDLGEFFHLRYLGLRWTFLDTLPESIGNLCYLETLDIKHTYIATLPPYIWKMKHLKHLHANGIHLDLPRNPRGSLPPLETLAGFSVNDTSFKNESSLKMLGNITELEITFQLSNSNQNLLFGWISSLKEIQALRLRSKDHIGRPSSILLKPLSALMQLTHLNLLGKLQNLPGENTFPPSLKVLTLALSELTEDPMPILGKLPNLTALRLLANSYSGRTMTCPAVGFQELRVLKLWMLKNLEDWVVEEKAMTKLKELNIRCCDKLKSIPVILLQQIKELTLTSSKSSEVPDFIRQVQVPDTAIPIINSYDFTTLPWDM